MKIYRNDKIIKFLGEKSSILFSQHFDFVNKIKEIVKIKEKKIRLCECRVFVL